MKHHCETGYLLSQTHYRLGESRDIIKRVHFHSSIGRPSADQMQICAQEVSWQPTNAPRNGKLRKPLEMILIKRARQLEKCEEKQKQRLKRSKPSKMYIFLLSGNVRHHFTLHQSDFPLIFVCELIEIIFSHFNKDSIALIRFVCVALRCAATFIYSTRKSECTISFVYEKGTNKN